MRILVRNRFDVRIICAKQERILDFKQPAVQKCLILSVIASANKNVIQHQRAGLRLYTN